ncbi:MAG: hypothetical protein ACD_56C00146G0006 [uncultured bacterium]|nr:MAG: hypothetical protein ACD_56C00146G0006 [uncultured bacterium]
MIKKGIILGALSLAVVGMGVYSFSALAAPAQGQFGPNYTPERHEAMLKAFESNDYNAWKTQMGSRGAARVVTEQNFERFSQMHELMLAGKTDEANKIRTELGLGQGGGRGQGSMGGQRGQNRGGNFVDANNDGICDHLRK